MTILRFIAGLLGLSLIVGEAYRSWGAGRPAAFWMDDMLMGGLLVIAALLAAKATPVRRALFTGAWGVCCGMLYISFFDKVFAPDAATPGNFDLGVLTALIGVALATAMIGFIASLLLPFKLAS